MHPLSCAQKVFSAALQRSGPHKAQQSNKPQLKCCLSSCLSLRLLYKQRISRLRGAGRFARKADCPGMADTVAARMYFRL
jgi:hypothetical protein